MDIFVIALLAFLVQIVTNIILLIKVLPLVKIDKKKKVSASTLFDNSNTTDITELLKNMVNNNESV